MRRYRRALAGGALLMAVGLAGCEQMNRTVEDALAQDPPAEARDRLQQQLGDIPTELDTTAATRLSAAFRAASARALPAVVQIRTVAVTDAPAQGFFPGFRQESGPQRTQGTGSGFIFDPRGYILTNNHVVRNAISVQVSMLDGNEYNAEVIGTDINTDIAVIRIDPGERELPVIELGESDRIRVGDWVIALGNPLGLTFTATAGIVSAQGRSIGILAAEGAGNTALEAFIQTDAAINPGNSGGPLVDLNGRVVGINTAIESATGYFTGAGFAIPINLAKKIADDIMRYGAVHRPRLGVQIQDVNSADAEVYSLPSIAGVEVIAVTPGTPADRAGLQLGDVILNIDDQPVNTVPELQARIALFQPGDRVRVGFIRYGRSLSTTVQLGAFERQEAAAPVEQPPRSSNPLGFAVAPLPPAMQSGSLRGQNIPVVTSVDRLGPAAGSGLDRYHVIRRFNGNEIRSIRDLERAAAGVRSGQVVSLIVIDARDPEATPMIVNYRLQ
jgi:serine protease Do